MDRWQRIIMLVLAVLICLPVALKSCNTGKIPGATAFSVYSSSGGLVRISGAVRHPGLYPISDKMLTMAVIKMAEPNSVISGFVSCGSAEHRPVPGDTLQLSVSEDHFATVCFGTIPPIERMVLGLPLDINSMNTNDYELVPGIGPVLAKRIFEYRQKNGGKMHVEDLREIEGVGEKKYKAISAYF